MVEKSNDFEPSWKEILNTCKPNKYRSYLQGLVKFVNEISKPLST